MKTEPWHEISILSSPVNECGLRKIVTRTSSRIYPLSLMHPKCTVLPAAFCSEMGFKLRVQNSFSVISIALGPDKRITAIAPVPWAVARAEMVSSRR